jgi:hypothetical protein
MNKEQRIKEQIIKCYSLFKHHNIWSDNQDIFKKNYREYALKNHPDKGGSHEVFSYANNCNDILKNDFELFKMIGKQSEPQLQPSPRSDSIPKPSPRSDSIPKPTHSDFIQKRCGGKRGGWTTLELQQICFKLNIKFSMGNDKETLCKKISDYFYNDKQESELRRRKDKKLREIREIKINMMEKMNDLLKEESVLKIRKEKLQKQINELENLEREFI